MSVLVRIHKNNTGGDHSSCFGLFFLKFSELMSRLPPLLDASAGTHRPI